MEERQKMHWWKRNCRNDCLEHQIQPMLLNRLRSGLDEEWLERCVKIGCKQNVWGQFGKKGTFALSHECPSCYKTPKDDFAWCVARDVMPGIRCQLQRTKAHTFIVLFVTSSYVGTTYIELLMYASRKPVWVPEMCWWSLREYATPGSAIGEFWLFCVNPWKTFS